MSPRAAFLCHPEPTFLSPRGVSRGVPRHLRASGRRKRGARRGMTRWGVDASLSLGMTGWRLSPRAAFLCHPEPPFHVTPRRQPRGPSALACLGMTKRKAHRAYFYIAPSHFYVAPNPLFLSPRAPFFIAPRRKGRGLPRDAVPSEVMRDAVPNEVRDASLSLGKIKEGLIGRTKNGGSAR